MRTLLLMVVIISIGGTCPAEDFLRENALEADSVYADSIVITEINYNSAPSFDTEDWVEFYNNSSSAIDLAGWTFKDAHDSNQFVFPQYTIIEPREFLVLCRSFVIFSLFFPEVQNYIGEFNFNISNGGELIRLFDNLGYLVDSLTFDDEAPWPVQPDGNGPTLVLIEPDLPNHLAQSWQASTAPHGSPGQPNGWVGVNDTPVYAPADYCLHSPYPNPFNNQTMLSFSVAHPGLVTLTVYDVSGREIAELANGYYDAGLFEVNFDAKELSTGVYFVRMTAGSFTDVRKIVLMK